MEPVRPEIVRDTLEELAADLPIDAVRIGMLGAAGVAEVTADFLERLRCPVVVLDPIIRASSGAALLDPKGLQILRNRLLPLSTVVTPNINEAAELTGIAVEDESGQRLAAERLLKMGSKSAVVTGGHLAEAADLLVWQENGEVCEQWFRALKLESRSTHGTGCAFATSLACNLSVGKSLPDSVAAAKEFVRQAIAAAEPLGKGTGPMKLI
jgi:hydroxymethylpyrimidine/phosphomethylpyrimidine kinase